MHICLILLTYNKYNFLIHIELICVEDEGEFVYIFETVDISGTTYMLNKQGYEAIYLGSKMQFYFIWKETYCRTFLTNG